MRQHRGWQLLVLAVAGLSGAVGLPCAAGEKPGEGVLVLRLTAAGKTPGPRPAFPEKVKAPVLELDAEGAVRVAGRERPLRGAEIPGYLRGERARAEAPLVVAVRVRPGAGCGHLAALLAACRQSGFRHLRLAAGDGEEHLLALAPRERAAKDPPRAAPRELEEVLELPPLVVSVKGTRRGVSGVTLGDAAGTVRLPRGGWAEALEKGLRKWAREQASVKGAPSVDVRADGSLACADLARVIAVCRKAGFRPASVLEPPPEAPPLLNDVERAVEPVVPPPGGFRRDDEVRVPGVVVPPGTAPGVPPPPGLGAGAGAGLGSLSDFRLTPGGFGGRIGATRDRLLTKAGGTAQSEAAVARGLRWLALHQAPDGRWSLDEFNKHARTELNSARYADDKSTGRGMNNDVAGTAFGLLPFLAAGITHKTDRGANKVYAKTVAAGLHYLLKKQGRGGDFGRGMYAQALATTALCEAYGLTRDPLLRKPAQDALNFIVAAQDPVGGGWRYQPRQGGDTSVTGWQVAALKSGQMAGLHVPRATFGRAEKWLDSCATPDRSGYGYTGPQETPTMTAVGLLCRQYLGWTRRHPGLLRGADKLRSKHLPSRSPNTYYEYYATQVMHHMGGDYWEFWNKGDGKNFKGMRDTLIERQSPDGSWDPRGDGHAAAGGRVMTTSLSLLTLEVYYRHLPLYQRSATGTGGRR